MYTCNNTYIHSWQHCRVYKYIHDMAYFVYINTETRSCVPSALGCLEDLAMQFKMFWSSKMLRVFSNHPTDFNLKLGEGGMIIAMRMYRCIHCMFKHMCRAAATTTPRPVKYLWKPCSPTREKQPAMPAPETCKSPWGKVWRSLGNPLCAHPQHPNR